MFLAAGLSGLDLAKPIWKPLLIPRITKFVKAWSGWWLNAFSHSSRTSGVEMAVSVGICTLGMPGALVNCSNAMRSEVYGLQPTK